MYRKISKQRLNTAASIKMLSYSMKDLAEYLENETQELMNIVRPRTAW